MSAYTVNAGVQVQYSRCVDLDKPGITRASLCFESALENLSRLLHFRLNTKVIVVAATTSVNSSTLNMIMSMVEKPIFS